MDKQKFKQLISLLESSSGTQTQQPTVNSGMHTGTKAIGEYGMMPKTIQDLAKTRINQDQGSNLDQIVQQANPKSVDEILASNPDKYQQYMDQMGNKVLDKSKGNAEEAAMRWLAGPNASKEKINDAEDADPNRMEKIQDFMKSSQKVEPTYTEQLLEQEQPKEVLYNKIRSKLGVK